MSKNLSIKVFKDKTLSDIMSDIYDNAEQTANDIKGLISSLTPMITSASEAVMLVPLIAKYMETKVKNDENLIKMSAVIQRSLDNADKINNDGNLLLSDGEMESIFLIAKDMEKGKKLLLENENI